MEVEEPKTTEAAPSAAAAADSNSIAEAVPEREDAAAAVDGTQDNIMDSESDDNNMIDVINESLEELLTKAQEKADAAAEVAAKKREEADEADAVAEDMAEKIDILRENAQALADDEKWQSMYHKLRAWSKEKGHCNPRRNWKSKIDAEEKALGNWSGKQRRQEKEGKLNPFKKTALERIGFTFDTVQQSWDEFHKNLKEHVSKNGKLPEKLTELRGENQSEGIYTNVLYYRQIPKQMLGICKYHDTKSAFKNERFTQERIDILTEAGLNWQLTAENVNALKERGLTFPMPVVDKQQKDIENGDIPALTKHYWLQMFEALVGFKKKNGHTFVTQFNSSPELHHWVCEQRKKMRQPRMYMKDQMFRDHQAQIMLLSIGFVFSEADVDWMDNYEKLAAYRRLFEGGAVTDKFCSFEVLEQWLDDNKRLHLNLPRLASYEVATWEHVTIPKQDRLKLLKEIGAFDVETEEQVVRKSHDFFCNPEQVANYSVARRKKEEELKIKGPIHASDPQMKASAAKKDESSSTSPAANEVINHIDDYNIDAKTEREFFLQQGAIVSASISERAEIPKSNGRRYFDDGRPIILCRIAGCFCGGSKSATQYMCTRHFKMIKGFAAREALAERVQNNSSAEKTTEGNVSIEWECSYCDKKIDTYDGVTNHEKHVEEAVIIAPTRRPTHPPRTKASIQKHLKGEAKVLAENYWFMSWKLAKDYEKKSTEQPTKDHKKHVSAALGVESSLKPIEDNFHLPVIKFPTKEAELESVQLFRRCCGPLAATFPGRQKLIKDGTRFYGDGRPLEFCRMAGCRMVHSDNTATMFLCDWHHVMIQRPLEREAAYTQSSEATNSYNKAQLVQATGPKAKVVAPTVKLGMGIDLLNHANLPGTVVATVRGRQKLIDDGALLYDDGRPLKFCRMAGCHMVHSDNTTTMFLCDWHHWMIQRPLESGMAKKRNREESAYTQSRKSTKSYNEAQPVQAPGPNEKVVALPAKLGIGLANDANLPGTVVRSVQRSGATANDALSDAQQWDIHYGALILFFEEKGHTNVPSEHVLHPWVVEQRLIFRELSEHQLKQLRVLNFWFPGNPHLPVHVGHCQACNKFAAFNGFCHKHYSTNAAAAANHCN